MLVGADSVCTCRYREQNHTFICIVVNCLKVFEEANVLEACVRKLNVADSFRRGKARRQDLPLRSKKSNSECWQRRYKGEQRAETI